MFKLLPFTLLFLGLWWVVRELRSRRQCPQCRVWVRPVPEQRRVLFWSRPTGLVQCPLCRHTWKEQYPIEPLPPKH